MAKRKINQEQLAIEIKFTVLQADKNFDNLTKLLSELSGEKIIYLGKDESGENMFSVTN